MPYNELFGSTGLPVEFDQDDIELISGGALVPNELLPQIGVCPGCSPPPPPL